jgi:WD40 repeat protein
VDRSLAVAGPDGEDSIMLHDVFRAYLRELAGDRLPVWHASLLDAHRPGTGSWADLPTGSRYLWAHLPHHLHGAGLDSELLATLASPDYVTRKVVLLGRQALTKDRSVLDRCATDSPNDKAWAETARLLSDSAYLLDGLRNPADIAATLLARCLRAGSPAGVDRLRERASAGDLDVRVHWARAGLSGDGADAGNGHVGAITSVAVHEDQVVSVGEDGVVRLRDLTSGRLVWSRQAHTGWIYATAVSPDGRTVATAGDDGQIRTWDARTGEPGGALTGHHRRVRSLAFTPRDRLLVSGGEDGQIRIWDIESRSCVGSLQTSGVPVWSVAVDSAQSVVAAVGEDDTVRLYDLRDGSLLDHGNCDDDWVRVAAFAPDRPLLVTAAATGPVRFWDVRNRALTRAGDRPVGERIRCLAFTQDGQAVAAGTENASMQLLPTTPDAPSPSTPPLPGVDWIRAVATGREGRVVAGCEDGALRAWDPDGKEPPHLITAGATTVWSTAVLHERRLTFHGRSDGLVDVCDSDSGHVRQQLTVGTGRVWSLAAARSHVAATCGDTHIRVWNAENLTLVADFDTEAGRTWAVALDPRGSRLAASSADGTVRIWDLPSGVLITRLRAHTGRIRSLAFDDRGDLLASAGGEGAAQVWEVPTGACRTEIIDTSRWVRCVSLDPSGERLAVGYGPGDIHVHDVQSGGTLAELRGHNGRILALALGQDADPLVSAAADGTVRAWSPHSGRQLLQLRADASLNCAAIDRDSNMVLTGSANGLTAIHVSDVPADERTP